MIKAGACYVVETQFTKDGSIEIALFEDSNDADYFAATQAIDFMVSNFECDKIGAPKDYKDAYNSILVRYNGGSYDLVMDEFASFNDKVISVVDPDNIIDIVTYVKNIKPSQATTANGWSAVGNTNLGNIKTIGALSNFIKPIFNCTPTIPATATTVIQEVLVDVPCKVCKRNVNKSEKTCWHCGCDNPASNS